MMTKLPFSAHFLDVLYKSVEKHGKDKPLTLGHLLGIVKLAIKLTRKHNLAVDRIAAAQHDKDRKVFNNPND